MLQTLAIRTRFLSHSRMDDDWYVRGKPRIFAEFKCSVFELTLVLLDRDPVTFLEKIELRLLLLPMTGVREQPAFATIRLGRTSSTTTPNLESDIIENEFIPNTIDGCRGGRYSYCCHLSRCMYEETVYVDSESSFLIFEELERCYPHGKKVFIVRYHERQFRTYEHHHQQYDEEQFCRVLPKEANARLVLSPREEKKSNDTIVALLTTRMECGVCFETQNLDFFPISIPCRHVGTCVTCCEKLGTPMKCPFCRCCVESLVVPTAKSRYKVVMSLD